MTVSLPKPSRPDPEGPAAIHVPKSLGEWIAELRLTLRKPGRESRSVRSWARADLAERAGLSEVAVYYIETDRQLPRIDLLDRILRALDVMPALAQVLRDMWLARATHQPPPPRPSRSERAVLLRRLDETPFPAVLLDELFFIKAANRYFQHLQPAYFESESRPSAILAALGPRIAPADPERFRTGALQRFFVHTARWSTQEGYRPLLGHVEARLLVQPDWRNLFHRPDVGIPDLMPADAYQDPSRSLLLRTLQPTRSRLDEYERLRSEADRVGRPLFIADDWH